MELPYEIYQNIINYTNRSTLGRFSQTSSDMHDLSQQRRILERQEYLKEQQIKDYINDIQFNDYTITFKIKKDGMIKFLNYLNLNHPELTQDLNQNLKGIDILIDFDEGEFYAFLGVIMENYGYTNEIKILTRDEVYNILYYILSENILGKTLFE